MKDPNQLLTQIEHDQLKALLQSKNVKAADVAAALGDDLADRNRRQLEEDLTRWLAQRPKG